VFAASILLFAANWILARSNESVAFWFYSTSIDVLDKLHQIGLPQLTREVGWPEPTRLGSLISLFLWWLFYFVIAFVVGALIRRFRFHGTHTV